MLPFVFQLQTAQDELDEEKSKRHKNRDIPEVNGPEMQLYEIQSKSRSMIKFYYMVLIDV